MSSFSAMNFVPIGEKKYSPSHGIFRSPEIKSRNLSTDSTTQTPSISTVLLPTAARVRMYEYVAHGFTCNLPSYIFLSSLTTNLRVVYLGTKPALCQYLRRKNLQ